MSDAHGVARDQLRAFIERIERLEEEKKTIADDIKDVYGEAKGMGFDTKILKKVVALRKKDEQERMEEEAILDTYLLALGMIESPPARRLILPAYYRCRQAAGLPAAFLLRWKQLPKQPACRIEIKKKNRRIAPAVFDFSSIGRLSSC
ncbi:uncharacterized protein (UPF0335 family) [Rhizobium laguerreae]